MIRTVLDWETAYGTSPTGRNVTLSAMTTEEYVRDKEFKIHGLGVKLNNERSFYLYNKDDLLHFLKTHPWGKSFVIAHHAHFDGAILSWLCGIRPAFWGCTLSMARAIYPHESASLNNIAKLLKVGEKGIELESVKSKWVLTDREQQILGGYCRKDIDLTSDIFEGLKSHFPASELRLIDWTVRRFTEPAFVVDRSPLVAAYKQERRNKRALLKACNVEKKELASNEQFAALLLTLGVDPPKKVSPAKVKDGRVDPDALGDPPMGVLPSLKAAKGMSVEERVELKEKKRLYPWAYAFGKTDEAFKMLLDHPDPQVQAIIEARMGIKSTIKETRSKRFFKIGTRGRFPVYLNYYGAHTNRWSGGDKQNAQNLNRVDYRDPTAGALRMSLCALPGHVTVVRDLGQIEARMLAYWAGQEDMLEIFRTGGDPYNYMATKIYGYEVDRKNNPEHKSEGQVGKIVVLGCGYQMGAWKLQENIRVGFMGMPGFIFGREYVEKLKVDVEGFKYQKSYRPGFSSAEEQAIACCPLNVSIEDHITHCAVTKHLVDVFRYSNDAVVNLWNALRNALPYMLGGHDVPVGVRNLVTATNEGLELPNGMKIRYHGLRQSSSSTREYKYLSNKRKKEWTKIYGGKMAENGTQALSRLVLSDQLLELLPYLKSYSLRPGEVAEIVSSTHDELIAVVPERYADDCLQTMKTVMATPPAWCPDLPLKSSGGYAVSYGDCEK